MAKIEWDKKTGGVVLKRHYSNETLSVSPRPVFFEELNGTLANFRGIM